MFYDGRELERRKEKYYLDKTYENHQGRLAKSLPIILVDQCSKEKSIKQLSIGEENFETNERNVSPSRIVCYEVNISETLASLKLFRFR